MDIKIYENLREELCLPKELWDYIITLWKTFIYDEELLPFKKEFEIRNRTMNGERGCNNIVMHPNDVIHFTDLNLKKIRKVARDCYWKCLPRIFIIISFQQNELWFYDKCTQFYLSYSDIEFSYIDPMFFKKVKPALDVKEDKINYPSTPNDSYEEDITPDYDYTTFEDDGYEELWE